jgi:Putative beta-barrel porin-2, OmpL-like. bbp2
MRLKLRKSAIILCFFTSLCAWAGNDSLQLGIGGYVEIFYAYDFNRPTTPYRQTFLVNHNRHNEFNINLGMVQLSADHPRYHAVLDLQVGTYAQDNYAREPEVMRHIYQGYVGIALDKRSRWWVDTGIFLSHLGFESLISPENLTLTRLLISENIPYYLSGAKLIFKPNARWTFQGIVANGWQTIQREPGNSLPAFGTEVKYSNPEKFGIHWSTFVSSSDPDSIRRMRYYTNIDFGFKLFKKWSLIVFYNHILQQQSRGSSELDQTNSTGFILGYQIHPKWRTAFRWEYYNDPEKVITTNPSPEPFVSRGASLNLDYSPWKPIMARIEGRWLNSNNAIFSKEAGFVRNNFFIVLSFSALIPSSIQ